MLPESLYSIPAERTCLGGFIKNPKLLMEIDFISEKDFHHKVHRNIFSILRNLVFNGQNSDKVILAQKCKELNINSFEEINLFDYLDSASYTQINENGLKDLVKDLIKLRIRRELFENAQEVQNFIKTSGDADVSEIISRTDSIYNSKVLEYSTNDAPKDIYKEIEPFLKEIAANPKDEAGLKTPYNWFNRYFSGLKAGDGAYFFYARMSEGKSVWMYNLVQGTALLNKVPCLFLDTEMSLDLNMYRAAAMEADINSFYFETGKWSKNKELYDKVNKSFQQYKKYQGLIYHHYVPNRDIYDIINIIKKWYYKHVGRGNPAMVVYDYIKITSDSSKDRTEWQQLGDKISYLNEIGHDLNIQIIAAGQQNRAGNQNGVRLDDDTTVGGSDRINQYARFSAIFRRKTPEEIAEHGINEGTHILKPTKYSRDQGVDDFKSNNLVKIIDPFTKKARYHPNYISYEIKNYRVMERSTLAELAIKMNLSANLQKPKDNKVNI